MKKSIVLLAALSWASFPSAAKAQGVFNMGSLTNTLSMGAVVKSESERAAKMRGGSARHPAATKSSRASLAFTQSAALRRRNMTRFFAQVRRADPASGAEIQKSLTSQDVFGQAGRWMKRYGMKTNNVADATAVYLSSAWLAARGSNADPSNAQMLGLRKQMSDAIIATPEFRKASAAQKQELADNMILHSALLSLYIVTAKKHPALMPRVKAAAVSGARATFGFDLNALKLTSRGLQS